MKMTLAMVALITSVPVGTALAESDCLVPMADWQPRHKVAELAKAQGWQAKRIKIDDGCYEIIGKDDKGRDIEVKLLPSTLEIVAFKYGKDEDED